MRSSGPSTTRSSRSTGAGDGRYDLIDRLSAVRISITGSAAGTAGAHRRSLLPFKLQLTSPGARFFQLYSPATGGIFVAEPVTHANAALNEPEEQWPELGMRVLAPGEAMNLSMRLAVIPQSAASG